MLLAQRIDKDMKRHVYVFYIGEIDETHTYLEGDNFIDNRDFSLFLRRFKILKSLE